MSQASRHLRHCAFSHPEIWNDLSEALPYTSDGFDMLGFVSNLIGRTSPTAPLQLTLPINVWDPSDCEDSFLTVESHLSRLSFLSLQLSRRHSDQEDSDAVHRRAVQILDSYLSSPAPLLRYLRIYICGDCCSAVLPIASTIFNGHAPNLATSYLRNISLTAHKYAAFSSLTSFTYIPRSRDIVPSVLQSILASCPRLLNLKLGLWDFNKTNREETPTLLHPHATLRNIHVNWVDNGFTELFDYLMNIPMQRLVCSSRTDVEQWNQFLDSFTVDRLEFGRELCEADSHHIGTGRPLRLRFQPDPFLRVYDLLAESRTYTHLTSLSIHEFYWPRRVAFPESTSLRSLRIMLASCSDILTSYVGPSACGIFQATSQTAWSLPGLQKLDLTYWLSTRCQVPKRVCRCRKRLTISLSDVHSFVVSCLRLSVGRLSKITLCGVKVIDRPPEAWLKRLNELAEEFAILPSFCPTSVDAPRRVWNGEFEDMFQDNLFDDAAG